MALEGGGQKNWRWLDRSRLGLAGEITKRQLDVAGEKKQAEKVGVCVYTCVHVHVRVGNEAKSGFHFGCAGREKKKGKKKVASEAKLGPKRRYDAMHIALQCCHDDDVLRMQHVPVRRAGERGRRLLRV